MRGKNGTTDDQRIGDSNGKFVRKQRYFSKDDRCEDPSTTCTKQTNLDRNDKPLCSQTNSKELSRSFSYESISSFDNDTKTDMLEE